MANISTGVVFSENTLTCSGGMESRIEPLKHRPPGLSGESPVKENLGWARTGGHALGVAAGEEERERL